MTTPPCRPAVVAFDFDGTLTHRDSLLPFLRRVVGLPHLTSGLVAAQWAWRFGGEPGRERAKRTLLRRTLKGVSNQQLTTIGNEYAAYLIDTKLRPDVAARLEAHRAAGHRIVLVSAGLGYYLDPLAHRLGIGSVICSRVGSDASGRCTGELRGRNVQGEVKADRLTSMLEDGSQLVYAYGNDARRDGPMLAMAEIPYLVDRHPVPDLPTRDPEKPRSAEVS